MQRTSTHSAARPVFALEANGLGVFANSLAGKVALGLAATVAVALAAHVSFRLPFTLVPLTLQPLAVLGVGLAFGPLGGFLTMLTYLAEGAAGLPVFSPGGLGGVAQIVGPTGGYLMAYPMVAAVTGGVARALRDRVPAFVAAVTSCSAAVALLYLCGAGWLLLQLHLSARGAWIQGVLPFLPGEIVKILAAAGTYCALTRARRMEAPGIV